jgi:hypothetical protein
MLEDPDQFNPVLVATLASFFGWTGTASGAQ